ncbi:MAG: hypothetical protein LBK71_08875 [Verrucomicrobiales bacterium]|nr:hypothetical protein [Verrucomicrobiales bacterium]
MCIRVHPWLKILWFALSVSATVNAAEIRAVDVDGRERVLNGSGRVHVVIYSNEEVQDATRAASRALDELQGVRAFRSVIVVDLRGSLAHLAPGYAQRRMMRDLDAEAERLTPFYRNNGNGGDPRADLSVVADFKGELAARLGWRESAATLRVLVFDQAGREAARWEDLRDYARLRKTVGQLLGKPSHE